MLCCSFACLAGKDLLKESRKRGKEESRKGAALLTFMYSIYMYKRDIGVHGKCTDNSPINIWDNVSFVRAPQRFRLTCTPSQKGAGRDVHMYTCTHEYGCMSRGVSMLILRHVKSMAINVLQLVKCTRLGMNLLNKLLLPVQGHVLQGHS